MTCINTHYEVLGYDGRRWALIEITETEARALEIAKTARSSGRRKAVKILREKQDGFGDEIQTIQIYYDGVKVQSDEQGAASDKHRSAHCWKAADLYSYEGRRTIATLLARTLRQWQITPTELLHNPEYYRRLNNEGSALQNVVQRVAIGQIETLDITVQERMRQIYDIISQAVGVLMTTLKRPVVPSLDPGRYNNELYAIEFDDDRSLLLLAGISEQLAQTGSLPAKAEFMLEFLERSLPSWAVRVLDPLLAEIFAGPAQLDLLFPDAHDSFTQLQSIQALLDGIATKRTARFAHYIQAGKLVEFCTMLERTSVRLVCAADGFANGEMLNELQAMQTVKGAFNQYLDRNTEFAWKLGKALSERSHRIMSPPAIVKYVGESEDPLWKAERLIALEPLAIGRSSQRCIVEFLMPLVASPPNQMAMVSAPTKVVQRLRRLATLQHEIITAEFEEAEKHQLARLLDQIGFRLLKEHHILERIAEAPKPQWQKTLQLLELTADGYFCQGMCLDLVRDTLRPLLKGSKLLDAILAQALTEEEKTEKLMHLMHLLQVSGMAEGAPQSGEAECQTTSPAHPAQLSA